MRVDRFSQVTHTGLLKLLARDPALSDAVETPQTVLDLTVTESARPALIAAFAAQTQKPLLVITSTYRQAEAMSVAISSLMSPEAVAYYPAWETLPHEKLSPRSDIVGKRLEVLRRMAGNDDSPPPQVIVAPVRSALQPQVIGLGEMRPVVIGVGSAHDLTELANDLVAAAYTRVDMVEHRGEFAVRGGIVDVFPPQLEHPVRVDFFGDEVEQIRPFHVADQRSIAEELPEVVALPCRELLITDRVKQRATVLAKAHPELSEMCSRIAEGHAVPGMESLAPVLADGMELLTDTLGDGATVFVNDPELVSARAKELVATSQEFLSASWSGAAGGGEAPLDLGESAYRSLAAVRRSALDAGLAWWSLSSWVAPVAAEDAQGDAEQQTDEPDQQAVEPESGVSSIQFDWTPAPHWDGDIERAAEDIADTLGGKQRVVVSLATSGLAERMAEILTERNLSYELTPDMAETPSPGTISIMVSDLESGFCCPSLELCVITGTDFLGKTSSRVQTRKMPSRRRATISPLELKPGEPLVHETHGVGRYVGLTQRTVQGVTRDYLVIEYAPSKRGQPADRLYLPMDSLDVLSRYVGGDSPALDKMGGADWRKRKARASKAVREIAAELIKLYAARQSTKGHAFGSDTTWQRELEASFAYTETPDQLAAVEEVKRDMEREVPMDRLVCGDVGFGKTEIAIRAAFKAVADGRQVAVLVPTTLLVEQHFQTFTERYAGFPVRVASLSRFQTKAKARAILRDVASGKIDVLVGTHRLLSGEVQFRSLGLVIIDEEQRFGVEHKERLKQLRVNVDVLAMSATPIPRTLEMAVSGIREMSVIATPPEERQPVLTFVGPYDDKQVTAAIRRELAREGQVFFIHNRVNTIEKIAKRVAELVPEARVATAHGQMGERALEQVMVDFWERDADVLVCTTIVESGLDISTANTLIVDRADLLGLAQLHQLRGRVGRSRERGYAYFLYRPGAELTTTAHDRLATMASNTDLGAGMAIAMRDLEIRGAGNLLGGEQSGHIADVGFDLYLRLVGEAVAKFRGETDDAPREMRLELPLDAHLGTDYIESERLRLEMYKRLAQVRTDEDVADVASELADRYGPPPAAAQLLLAAARVRLAAQAQGIYEIVAQGRNVRVGPVSLPDSASMRMKRLYPGTVEKRDAQTVLIPRPESGGEPLRDEALLAWVQQMLSHLVS